MNCPTTNTLRQGSLLSFFITFLFLSSAFNSASAQSSTQTVMMNISIRADGGGFLGTDLLDHTRTELVLMEFNPNECTPGARFVLLSPTNEPLLVGEAHGTQEHFLELPAGSYSIRVERLDGAIIREAWFEIGS